MENRNADEPSQQESQQGRPTWLIILIVVAVVMLLFWRNDQHYDKVKWNFFLKELERENIAEVMISPQSGVITGKFKSPVILPAEEGAKKEDEKKTKEFYSRSPTSKIETPLIDKLRAQEAEIARAPDDNTVTFLYMFILLLPIILFGLLWLSYRRTRNDIMGGGFLSGFSKSPAKRYDGSDQAITFDDVAGLEGVKADLQEIVDYLSSPDKFRKLGGRVPKGVLLNGPPGTGKTLLARAVAGEAGVPYFSVNGSEFIQMFVGVGASRVRDLFKSAKENSPAIIFIDEIDAVGRQRGAGLGGGHDEREQTLNQILGEMDGFGGNDSVIVVAATNRPDVLDPALLRPGRFDRHVTVDRPTMKGREAIFKVHVREVPLAEDVNLKTLAAGTIGMTGADIRNVVNESALWAARHDKSEVDMSDFEYARDKILMGAKREEVLSLEEKEKTAYHEAGHTLAAWYLKGSNRVHKVTVIPRGRALGVTQTIPTEDRLNLSENEMRDQLVVLLAGRAAEKIIYDEATAGAENDLERATSLARRMVTHWGMSPKLGPVSYKSSNDDPFLGRELHQSKQFSEATQETIDSEVARILHEVADQAIKLLHDRRTELETVTKALVEREELSEDDLTELIGPSVHVPSTSETEQNDESSDSSEVDDS